MIQKIIEYDYKGFHLVLAEGEESGWNCIIGESEVRFPHSTAAEAAIDEILKNSDEVVKRHEGITVQKVLKSHVTKTVEEETAY